MISEGLAQFAATLEYDGIPGEAVESARRCFLDWLGSAIAGSFTEPGSIVASVALEMGGSPQATVLGRGRRIGAHAAALANGAASHTLELDDVHNASILHPAAVVMPAALAAGEKVGASGKDLLRAIIVGYDVAIRTGMAVTPSHYKFWHTTGTCGTLGAAAAAGAILRLDGRQLLDALGNAGTQAAGLWEFLENGAMSKCLHAGKAASNGLLAAELANRGFTGAARILEGDRGLFRATAPSYDESLVLRNLGDEFYVTDVSLKPYPSCRHTHPAVDCAIKLRAEGLRLNQVLQLRVFTNSVAAGLVDNPAPHDAYSAKFSLQYCVAAALAHGSLTASSFEEACLYDPSLRDFARDVVVLADAGLDAYYPARWGCRVEITTTAGRELQAQTAEPKGDPGNPLTAQELESKFLGLVEPVLGGELAGQLVEECRTLAALEDIRQLTALLYADGTQPR